MIGRHTRDALATAVAIVKEIAKKHGHNNMSDVLHVASRLVLGDNIQQAASELSASLDKLQGDSGIEAAKHVHNALVQIAEQIHR